MEKDEKEELKERGIDLDKGTYNLDKMSGLPGFQNVMVKCHYDFHGGSDIRRLAEFIHKTANLAQQLGRDEVVEYLQQKIIDLREPTGEIKDVNWDDIFEKASNLKDLTS